MDLDIKKAIKCFEFFLKNNNCFEQYLDNCYYHKLEYDKFDYNNIFYKTDLNELIYLAFDWGETNEGYSFWDKLNNEWTTIVFRSNFLKFFNEIDKNKKKLLRFLKEYNIFNEYIKLVPNGKINSLLLYPYNVIDRSFDYSKTNKGYAFWKNINNEWNKIIIDEFIVND